MLLQCYLFCYLGFLFVFGFVFVLMISYSKEASNPLNFTVGSLQCSNTSDFQYKTWHQGKDQKFFSLDSLSGWFVSNSM